MSSFPENGLLLVIDVQKGFDDPVWGRRNNPQAEGNIAKLLAAWRRTARPVFYIQHLSRNPDSTLSPGSVGSEIKEIVRPRGDEPVIRKHVNSAFIGTELEARLRARGCETLVITGLTTPHCVSTTARMAGNLGFDTRVVADATAAFDWVGHDGKLYTAEEIHQISLVTLHREFAEIVETESLLEQLERGRKAGA
jgi:nicotinamidase-related amidase